MWVRGKYHLETIHRAELLSAFLRYDCPPPKRFHRDVNKMARSAWHQPIPYPAQPLCPEPYQVNFGRERSAQKALAFKQNGCGKTSG